MRQKKKGFTLIEVIVVMFVSTLVLAMVGGTMVFITTTTGDLIQEAEEIEMARNIENYLRALYARGNYDLDYHIDESNGNIKYGSDTIFSNTGLIDFDINPGFDDGFIKCYMKFESGRIFDFIIGIRP